MWGLPPTTGIILGVPIIVYRFYTQVSQFGKLPSKHSVKSIGSSKGWGLYGCLEEAVSPPKPKPRILEGEDGSSEGPRRHRPQGPQTLTPQTLDPKSLTFQPLDAKT